MNTQIINILEQKLEDTKQAVKKVLGREFNEQEVNILKNAAKDTIDLIERTKQNIIGINKDLEKSGSNVQLDISSHLYNKDMISIYFILASANLIKGLEVND